MKAIIFIEVVLVMFSSIRILGQNPVINIVQDSTELQRTVPETSIGFSITSYKNVDFNKINPMQLQLAGLHTEIYISNTNQGVIIISSYEANNALKDFRNTLDLNPTYYESLTRQDTTVFFSGNDNPQFDFTKASSINNNYKNAFNYKVDPRNGVSWSKGNYDKINLKESTFYGQMLHDIIIGIPKLK
jgi:hypothetical protein